MLTDERTVGSSGAPQRCQVAVSLLVALHCATASAALLAGCTDGVSMPGSRTVRDSAGVHITELVLPTGLAAPLWRVGPEPKLVLGDGRSPEHELHRVGPALRLRDGRLVVANEAPVELRIFDSTGAFAARVGREGAGPGEFRNISLMQLLPEDSILVFDRALRRLSVFAPDGTLGRSSVLAPQSSGNSTTLYAVAGMFEDGTILATGDRTLPAEGIVVPRTRVAWMSALLDSASDIREFPGDHILFSRTRSGGLAFWAPMFGRTTRYLVARDRFYVAISDTYEVQCYDRRGALLSTLRIIREPYRLSDDDFDEIVDSIADSRGDSEEADREQWREEISHYETLPTFSAVLLDAEQNVWVRDYPPPGQRSSRWSVFGPDDTFRAFVEIPDNDEVLFAGFGHVVVLSRGANDVEQVLVYQLHEDSEP